MFSVRNLDGSVEDMFNPKFRKVDFGSTPVVVLVSTHLRYAWSAIPSDDTSENGIGQFIKANYERSEEERKNVPQNPDRDNIHTPWRDSVYHNWNHVFYDVMKFLPDVNCSVGHFHPPSHDVFAVAYPRADGASVAVARKKWDTNMLMTPAHMEPGVSFRATVNERNEDGVAEKELGTFDGSNATEIWYIRKGVNINIYVEGNFDKGRRGIAAAMVVGILCSDIHEPGTECCERVEPADEDG